MELCQPGMEYRTRQELVDAILAMEARFNDPNDRLNQGLENAFLGSFISDSGVRRGGKLIH